MAKPLMLRIAATKTNPISVSRRINSNFMSVVLGEKYQIPVLKRVRRSDDGMAAIAILFNSFVEHVPVM